MMTEVEVVVVVVVAVAVVGVGPFAAGTVSLFISLFSSATTNKRDHKERIQYNAYDLMIEHIWFSYL
jgi:hypothetical protein